MNKQVETYIIDDNKIDLFINQRIITSVDPNAKTVLFQFPEKALTYFKKHIQAFIETSEEVERIILIDINMPVLNGFQLMEALSEIPGMSNSLFKLYILSSSTSLEDRNRAAEFSLCSGYLTKPLTKVSFLKVLETM
jgi:CheY-like chemotaxis protein